MGRSLPGKGVIIFIHALAGWALCGATMAVGMATMAMSTTLVLHAVLAPIFFFVLSLLYFKKFNYTTPLWTAVIFLFFVLFMDFFVVALAIEGSFAMFESLLGTWIPFALIFISTFATGLIVVKGRMSKERASQ
jgi:hypothetical protein